MAKHKHDEEEEFVEIEFSEELAAKIDRVAKLLGVSREEAIEKMIEEYIEVREKSAKPKRVTKKTPAAKKKKPRK